MKITKTIAAAAASGLLSLSLPGLALAASCAISETGPDSTNSCTIEQKNDVEVRNDNDVTVTNTNNQTASSGDARVSHNTTGGSAASGEASNSNAFTTAVSIDNGGGLGGGPNPSPGPGQGPVDSGKGGGQLPGGPIAGAQGVSETSSARVGGGGMLPVTGPEDETNVDKLRDILSQSPVGPESQVVSKAKGISAALMAVAAVLSLAGAIGAAYAGKKSMQV